MLVAEEEGSLPDAQNLPHSYQTRATTPNDSTVLPASLEAQSAAAGPNGLEAKSGKSCSAGYRGNAGDMDKFVGFRRGCWIENRSYKELQLLPAPGRKAFLDHWNAGVYSCARWALLKVDLAHVGGGFTENQAPLIIDPQIVGSPL